MTEKLNNLLQQKQMLSDLLKTTNEEIIQQQIIRPGYLNHLGFKQIETIKNLNIYEKPVNSTFFTLILDLEKPELVRFQKSGTGQVYGFEVTTVENFLELLNFLSIKNE